MSLKKKVNGIEVRVSKKEELELRAEWDKNAADKLEHERLFGYIAKRQEAYPDVGDQLDAIWKHLTYVQMLVARTDLTDAEKIKRMGNLVSEADSIMAQWLKAKRDHPKPKEV